MSSQQEYEVSRYAYLALAVLGVVVLWVGTPWGLGLSPDSVSYLHASRLILEEGRLGGVPSHWPPLLPMLIAGSAVLFGDPVFGARILQGFSLLATTLLLAALSLRVQGHTWVGLPLLALLVVQPDFVRVHMFLTSEPVFIALVLANVLVLEKVLTAANAWRWVLLLGLVSGLALMVRYAGVFLLLMNAAAILLWYTNSSWLGRTLRVLAASLPGVALLLIWMAFNRARDISATNRELVFHPPGWAQLQLGLETLAGWLHLPANLGWVVLGLMMALVVAPFLHRSGPSRETLVARLLATYVFFYSILVLAVITFVDAHTPLDGRILLPLLPALLSLLAHVLSSGKPSLVRWVGVAVLALVMAANAPSGMRIWQESFANGLGFASRQVQESGAIQYVRRLPASWQFATNGPEVFQLYLTQRAMMLPRFGNPNTREINPDFGNQFDRMAARVDAIVWFDWMGFRYYLPGPDLVNDQEGFVLVYLEEDAAVWVRREHLGTEIGQ